MYNFQNDNYPEKPAMTFLSIALSALIVLATILVLVITCLFFFGSSANAEEAIISVSEEEITLSVTEVEELLSDHDDYDPEFIKTIQRALNRKGAKLSVDGKFGPAMGNAVKRFQRKKGLEIDGIVGPKTLKALGIEDAGVYPYWHPCLATCFANSTNGRAVHLNIRSHLIEDYELREDGWHLVRVMLCATGNTKNGCYTDLCNVVLNRTPTPGGNIGGGKGKNAWRGNFAVPITNGDYFHSVLLHKNSKGEWTYGKDANSVLGKNVTHGCVRMSKDDAKWHQEFCTKGTVIVVDDRNWDLR